MTTAEVFEPVRKLARVQPETKDAALLIQARCGYQSDEVDEFASAFRFVTCSACLTHPAVGMVAT